MNDSETPNAPTETPETGAPEQAAAEATGEAEDRLEQEVTIEEAGPARKKITIEIPAARIADKLSENFDQLQSEATLPGFRRGRAPARLIEKRFGADVRNEVKSQLLSESYSQAVEENELRVIGEPDIKDLESLELPEEGPLQFEVEVEVAPEFELPDLTGLEIKKQKVELSEDDVAKEIERYKEMAGSLQTVEGQCEPGDYLTADVEVCDSEGEVVETHQAINVYVPGESRKYKGVVAGILVEDLGHKLEGHGPGETVRIEATGPRQHENEKIREQPITIDVKIGRAERMVDATVEEVLEKVGMASEEELREQVRQNMEARAEQQQKSDMHKQVTDAIVDRIDFDLPEGLSQRQAQRIQQRRAMEMMYQGASQQDIEEQIAELKSASEDEARRELKLFFVLNKVADEFDVEVSENEVNGRIAQMAIQSNQRPEKYRQEMAKSGQIEQLYIQIREEKAVEALIEKASIVEVEPDAEGEGEGEGAGDAEGEEKASE